MAGGTVCGRIEERETHVLELGRSPLVKMIMRCRMGKWRMTATGFGYFPMDGINLNSATRFCVLLDVEHFLPVLGIFLWVVSI